MMAENQGAFGFGAATVPPAPAAQGALPVVPSAPVCQEAGAERRTLGVGQEPPALRSSGGRKLGKFRGGQLSLRYRLMKLFANQGYVTGQGIAEAGRTEWKWQKSATTALREFRSVTRGFGLNIPPAATTESELRDAARACLPSPEQRSVLYSHVMSQVRRGTSVWLITPESRSRARALIVAADRFADAKG